MPKCIIFKNSKLQLKIKLRIFMKKAFHFFYLYLKTFNDDYF